MWYALRRSFRDRLLTLQPRDDRLALVAVNDSAERWSASVEISRRAHDGGILAKTAMVLDLAPRGASTIMLPADVATPQHPAGEIVLAEVGDDRAWWHFAEDIDAALPPAEVDTSVTTIDGGYRVTVVAQTIIRDLALLADQVAPDAVVNDMLVTLLPGDTAIFDVRSQASLDPAALTDPAVLRSANQLLHPASSTVSARGV